MRGQNHVHRQEMDIKTDGQGETINIPPQTMFGEGGITYPN